MLFKRWFNYRTFHLREYWSGRQLAYWLCLLKLFRDIVYVHLNGFVIWDMTVLRRKTSQDLRIKRKKSSVMKILAKINFWKALISCLQTIKSHQLSLLCCTLKMSMDIYSVSFISLLSLLSLRSLTELSSPARSKLMPCLLLLLLLIYLLFFFFYPESINVFFLVWWSNGFGQTTLRSSASHSRLTFTRK